MMTCNCSLAFTLNGLPATLTHTCPTTLVANSLDGMLRNGQARKAFVGPLVGEIL